MSASRTADRPVLALLHLAGGGCGGCALEFEAIPLAAWEALGLRLVATPRHADLLLVSGCVTRTLRHSVEACWTAMADPKRLVAIGACAVDGGPFRGGYAVQDGLGARLPVALAIPGCPPRPAVILEELRRLLDGPAAAEAAAVRSGSTAPAAIPAGPAPPIPDRPAPPPAPLPAATPRPLAGGDSSAG